MLESRGQLIAARRRPAARLAQSERIVGPRVERAGAQGQISLPKAGLVTLANDTVIESLTALLESIAEHEPLLPVTVIPYDDQASATEELVSRHGQSMLEGALLATMDEVGRRYWPDGSTSGHIMRKLCAFWSPHETFFFLDSDVVLLQPLEPYFDAFRTSGTDFLYFHSDMENCYRPGRFRDAYVRRYGSVGFNTGAFVSKRDALLPEEVLAYCSAAGSARKRGDFVDNLEQSFLNFCVDSAGLRKLGWVEAVPDLTAASALMLLRTRDGRMYLEDARTPDSGRPVAFLHWAGYRTGPFMPYRRTFRRYRLRTNRSRTAAVAYESGSLVRSLRRLRPRVVYGVLRRSRFHVTNWLAARGLISWPR